METRAKKDRKAICSFAVYRGKRGYKTRERTRHMWPIPYFHPCSSNLGSKRSGGARIMQKTSLLDSEWRGEVGPTPDIFVFT